MYIPLPRKRALTENLKTLHDTADSMVREAVSSGFAIPQSIREALSLRLREQLRISVSGQVHSFASTKVHRDLYSLTKGVLWKDANRGRNDRD